MSTPPVRQIEILLVEDSPTDVLFTREAIGQSTLVHALHVVPDGVEALAFLRQEGRYANAPRPSIILLDLNLPRKDGKEVLREIKNDDALKAIPVVVLTTSRTEEDVLQVYDLHANCYIVKPMEFEKFVDCMRAIEGFWSTVVTLAPMS